MKEEEEGNSSLKPATAEAHLSRRAFLLTLARGLVAGALLTSIGSLWWKKRGETCVGEGICRGCAEFADCGLPQALSAKQAARQHSG